LVPLTAAILNFSPASFLGGAIVLLAVIAGPVGCSSVHEASPPTTVVVSGVIRDREGIGIAGVVVFLDPADDKRTTGTSVATNHKGEYRLRVRKGPCCWMLFADHVRVQSVVKGDTILLAKPNERLDYCYGGLKVEGRILGPNGIAMKAGSVEAFGGVDPISRYSIDATGTVENGRYRMFLPASTYWLHAEPHPNRYPKIEREPRVRISADTTIDFTASGHLVTGTATIGPSRPLRGAEVEAHGKGVDGLEISAFDKTRHNGRFDLYLPSGDYAILVKPGPKDRHIAPRFVDFKVAGPQSVLADLAGVVWRGTVRDSTTRLPLRFVKVAARGWFPLVCKSDGRGRFKFILKPGVVYALALDTGNSYYTREPVGGAAASNDSTFDLYVATPRTGAR